MFKKTLEDNLINIFGIRRVSFAEPSSENEQNVLFINIASCKTSFSANKIYFDVRGQITLYAVNEKLPFGYFQRKIELSKKEHSEKLFFYNIEENLQYGGQVGLTERSASFVFSYSTDFNPNKGLINDINLIEMGV